jgi:formylglycine-generating enzyme required for sulfatase activity
MRLLPGTAILTSALQLATAQTPPDYDFQFSTVGALGNAPIQNSTLDYQFVNGRGSVGYAYRMSKLEVTTGQWMEFLNTFPSNTSPHAYWDSTTPDFWGAVKSGGKYVLRNDVSSASQLPVGGITWRMSALYCNWLHNGKQATASSLITGAYDSATWGFVGTTNVFTDAATHLPGAQYWIPTLDEQLKAFQYDPNRYGQGQGGWWESRNKSDTHGTPGLPGEGTTSAGYRPDGDPFIAWNIALGAYEGIESPWGLLDTSGGAEEWNEERYPPQPNDFGAGPTARGLYGTWAGQDPHEFQELIWGIKSGTIKANLLYPGLRIASTVPAVSTATFVSISLCMITRRRMV